MKVADKGRSLGELLKTAAMQPIAPKVQKQKELDQEQLVVKSVALTPDALERLERLMAEAGRGAGRKVSASAIVRALLFFAEKDMNAAQLVALIQTENRSGQVVWGRRSAPEV
jgi:hypothetical protein